MPNLPIRPIKRRGATTLVTVLLTLVAMGLFVLISPFAALAWKRHRVQGFCESVVPGESLDQVERRAFDQGLIEFLGVRALPDGPNEVDTSVMVREDFLLAHLICMVEGDSQGKVTGTRYNELW
jgi:hypothetical protein